MWPRMISLVFNEFYESGVINKSMNSTFIALIPKKGDVECNLDLGLGKGFTKDIGRTRLKACNGVKDCMTYAK